MPRAAPTIRIEEGDARDLPGVAPGSVELVVTSPPYPMIPQWDESFRHWGARTYPEMHERLAEVWTACHRALVPGGLLAVNIGDALRTGDDGFRLWPNHVDVERACEAAGFRPLPYILWKKPTNKPNAFLGSGFLPPNAYVTLDCEFILLFRRGALRAFPRADLADPTAGTRRPNGIGGSRRSGTMSAGYGRDRSAAARARSHRRSLGA